MTRWERSARAELLNTFEDEDEDEDEHEHDGTPSAER
jgi:hypothetical protein